MYHAEFESLPFFRSRKFWFLFFLFGVRYNRFIVLIFSYDRIVNCQSDVSENIKSHFGVNIKEFPILPNTQVCQSVYCLMHKSFNLIEFRSLHRGKDFKRQRHSGIVQLLWTNVNGTSTFTYFHPILSKTGIGQYINIAGVICFHTPSFSPKRMFW